MCDDAVASARTFLAEHLTERRVVEQTRIDEMLRQLVAVEALLSVLDHMDTADAAQHRTACRKERDHLIAGLSGHLYAWQLAGGRVVLLSPEGVPTDAAEPSGQQALIAEPLAEPTGDQSDLVDDEITQATTATTQSARTPDIEAGDVDAASSDQLEALRRSMGRWQESPLASPAAGTGVDVSASLQRLGRLLDHIDLPDINALLAGSLIDAETDALTDATENLDAEWGPLPAGYQRLLLSMYTCYVRYLQDLLSETDPLRMRLTSVFHRLVNFSRAWQPGRVNGLQLAHQPRHGSWLADAHDWLTQLRELAGLTADVAQSMRVKRDQGGATVAIEQILRDEGFTIPEAQLRAWSLLEQHNLTQRSKQTMAAAKLPRVAELFQSLRVRVGESHGECAGLRRTLLGLTDQPISVEGHFCDICGGSNNRRAALALVSRLRAERIERLLIVGGGDDSRADLDQLLAGWGIELRHVDGTKESHAQKDADLNMRWAQVMVVWGGTMLPHKISNLYRNPPDGLRAVNPNRRGIEALCRSVIESFDRQ